MCGRSCGGCITHHVNRRWWLSSKAPSSKRSQSAAPAPQYAVVCMRINAACQALPPALHARVPGPKLPNEYESAAWHFSHLTHNLQLPSHAGSIPTTRRYTRVSSAHNTVPHKQSTPRAGASMGGPGNQCRQRSSARLRSRRDAAPHKGLDQCERSTGPAAPLSSVPTPQRSLHTPTECPPLHPLGRRAAYPSRLGKRAAYPA